MPPDKPVMFNKFPTARLGHGVPIVLPRNSQEVDYEAELVATTGACPRRAMIDRLRTHLPFFIGQTPES